MKKLIGGVALSLSLVGCQTIFFEKGDARSDELSTPQAWHHGGGFAGLFEFSDPYNPTKACAGKEWTAVAIDHSFVTAFVSGVVPYGIYTPWAVASRCK